MVWRKLGKIFAPSGELDWSRTHAALPVPERIEGDIFRIYFSSRDEKNRSSIGCVVVDLAAGGKVLDIPAEPILRPGARGMFDDCGVSIGSVVRAGDKRFLYYTGWNLAVTVPWKNTIGLAISEAGGAFVRWSEFPVVALDERDPFSLSYPWVIEDQGTYHMWYGSNLGWGEGTDEILHVIKYAQSSDGVHWEKQDWAPVDTSGLGKTAACRPSVVRDPDVYRMWFCARGARYRIYCANSENGLTWSQIGEDQGITVSPGGWDSDMIEYPCVFDHGGQRFMLYSGDGYGRTGFGLAVQES
jgi:hypothetical protein